MEKTIPKEWQKVADQIHNKANKLFKSFFFYPQIDSTNKAAKDYAATPNAVSSIHFTLNQTQGKGQYDRTWFSSSQNLTFTLLYLSPNSNIPTSIFTVLTAMGIAQTVYDLTSIKPRLKWPNDLLINNRKFCGILSAGKTVGQEIKYILMGIGLNVNETRFPQEIKPTTTSLKIETGDHISLPQIFPKLISNIEFYLLEKHSLNGIITSLKEVNFLSLENEFIDSINQQFRSEEPSD